MKTTRHFVKYKDGEPMDTYRIDRDDIHPHRYFKEVCNVLIEQGYTETDFITEYDAWSKIIKIINAFPTLHEGNIELKRRRTLVNAVKYPDIHRIVKERLDGQKPTQVNEEGKEGERR